MRGAARARGARAPRVRYWQYRLSDEHLVAGRRLDRFVSFARVTERGCAEMGTVSTGVGRRIGRGTKDRTARPPRTSP